MADWRDEVNRIQGVTTQQPEQPITTERTPYVDPDDEGLRPWDRIQESVQTSFGTLWGGLSLAADKLGWEQGRDWASERSAELFEEASDLNLQHTSWEDVKQNPVNFLNWGAETLVSILPDLGMAATTGGVTGAASAAAKFTGKKAVTKAVAKKMLHKNLKKQARGQLTGVDALEMAYKDTARQIGSMAGVMAYEGAQLGSQAAMTEIEEKGYEEASLLRPLLVGTAAAGMAAFSPVQMALAKGIRNKATIATFAGSLVGEGIEESAQEALLIAHEVGIDPNMSLQQALDNPEFAARLEESFAAGALMGGALGGVEGAATYRATKKQEKLDKIIAEDKEAEREALKGLGVPTLDYEEGVPEMKRKIAFEKAKKGETAREKVQARKERLAKRVAENEKAARGLPDKLGTAIYEALDAAGKKDKGEVADTKTFDPEAREKRQAELEEAFEAPTLEQKKMAGRLVGGEVDYAAGAPTVEDWIEGEKEAETYRNLNRVLNVAKKVTKEGKAAAVKELMMAKKDGKMTDAFLNRRMDELMGEESNEVRAEVRKEIKEELQLLEPEKTSAYGAEGEIEAAIGDTTAAAVENKDTIKKELKKAVEAGQKDRAAEVLTAASSSTQAREIVNELEEEGVKGEILDNALDKAEEVGETKADPKQALIKAGKGKIINQLLNKDWEGLKESLSEYKKDEWTNVIGKAVSTTGEVGRANMDYLAPLIREAELATKTQKVEEVKGAKAADAIKWQAEGKKGADAEDATVQVGRHKTTGQELKLLRNDGKKEEEQNELAVRKEAGEDIKFLDKKKTYWDVVVDGKIVDTVFGKVEARRKAEDYVDPLTEKELAQQRKRGKHGKKKADVKYVVEDVGREKGEEESRKEEQPKTTEFSEVDKKALIAEYNKKYQKAEAAEGSSDPNIPTLKDDYEKAIFTAVSKAANNNAPASKWNYKKTADFLKKEWNLGDLTDAQLNVYMEINRIANARANKKKELFKQVEEKWKTVDDVLDHVVSNGSLFEKYMAKWIKKRVPQHRKDLIKIVGGSLTDDAPTAGYFKNQIILPHTGVKTGTILHEAVHAFTADALNSVDKSARPNREAQKLKNQLDDMRRVVLARLTYNEGDVFFTEEQKRIIESVDGDAVELKKHRKKFTSDEFTVAYALSNSKEFLSQAMNSDAFQQTMGKIRWDDKGKSKDTLFNKFVKTLMKFLGIGTRHYTAFEELLKHTDDLFSIDTQTSMDSLTKAAEPNANREDAEVRLDEGLAKHIKREKKQTKREWASEAKTGLSDTFSKLVQSTYERMHTISPQLAEAMRRMEARVNRELKKRIDVTRPFVQKMKKLEKKNYKDYRLLSFYLKNPGTIYKERADALLNKYNLKGEYNQVRDMLESTWKEADSLGLNDYAQVSSYFPRYVEDLDGLIKYLRKSEEWGVLEEGLQVLEDRKMKKTGEGLDSTEISQALTDMISTGNIPAGIGKKPGALKERTIQTLSPGMDKFYAAPHIALGNYMKEMTNKIEMNRMLGKTKHAKDVKRIRTLNRKLKVSGKLGKKEQLERDSLLVNLPTYKEKIEAGIGAILKDLISQGKLNEDNQFKAKEILRARITEHGPGNVVSNIRTGALLGSLTQITTGVRQLSDLTWSMYRNGIGRTLASIPEGIRNAKSKDNPFDFERTLKEFQDNPEWADKALRASGLMFMDRIGKSINMEASKRKAASMSPKAFKKKWGPIFGEETSQVYEDLKKDRQTENVEYLLFSELANFQPIALSEMPQAYLTAGNGRIFYLLKSYSLKAANTFYRESIQKIRNGDVAEGTANLVKLGTIYMLMGVGTDELIDMMLGREPDVKDSAIDTLATLGLMSKYSLDSLTRKGGIENVIEDSLLPPMGLIKLPFNTLIAAMKGETDYSAMKLVPGIGNIMYQNMTQEGKEANLKRAKQDFYDSIKSTGSIDRGEMVRLNSASRDIGVSGVNNTTIKKKIKESKEEGGSIFDMFGPKEAQADPHVLQGEQDYEIVQATVKNDIVKILGQDGVEGYETNLYIPGTPTDTSKSGATIGNGVDLAYQSESKWKKLGIPSYLINKAKPFFGKKGTKAKEQMDKDTPNFTAGEVAYLSNTITNDSMARIIKKIGTAKWNTYTEKEKAVATSLFHIYDTKWFSHSSYTQFVGKQWEELKANMEAYGDKTPNLAKGVNNRHKKMSEYIDDSKG